MGLALILPSYYSHKMNFLVRYGFMLMALILISYNFDAFERRDASDPTTSISDKHHIILSLVMLHFHHICLNPFERGHAFFGFLFITMIFISASTSSLNFQDLTLREAFQIYIPAIVVSLFVAGFLYYNESIHKELIAEIQAQMFNDKFL